MKFKIVSLGCPKNLVESEYVVKRLEEAGHSLSEEGELVIVNTCAFIADAAQESIETILEEAAAGEGAPRKIVVTGCLVERYGDKLRELLPEVNLFVGRNSYGEIETLIDRTGIFLKEGLFAETFPRKVLTAPPLAYLKIQEGCDNCCTYCAVPGIRGGLRSRTVEEIRQEFEWLVAEGYREINIIGQDITSYGRYADSSLARLLENLLLVEGDYFIRLLYMHPKGVDDELIDLIAREARIIPYMDIPIQHSEDRILKLMGRGYTKEYLEGLFVRIRSSMPDAVLRTTVIVGFPGETEEEFAALCEFAKAQRFDMLGAFMYSREEGTPAHRLKGQVKKGVKKERYNRIMEMQRDISRERLKRFEGKAARVIVEKAEGERMVGRLLTQAPDIDGLAYIDGACAVGEIRQGKIVKTRDYDVIVEL